MPGVKDLLMRVNKGELKTIDKDGNVLLSPPGGGFAG